MGHDEHRAAEIEQSRLERLARGNIKVVRRLVEQQDIRAREHQLQERKPRFFAAAQSLYLLENIVRAEQELPEGWKLLSLYNNDEYTETFARVVNSDRINNYKEWLDEWFGCPFVVGVDIFPLNYMPLDEDEAEIQKELYIIVKNARAVCQEHTEEAEQLLKLVEEVCRVTLDRSGNLERQLSMLLERIRIMYDAEEQGELTQIEVFSRKSFCRIPQEAYEKSIPMMFEGTDVQVPVGWDTVLRAEYGDDYMTPIQVRSSACHDYPFYKKQMKILEERSKGKQ